MDGTTRKEGAKSDMSKRLCHEGDMGHTRLRSSIRANCDGSDSTTALKDG